MGTCLKKWLKKKIKKAGTIAAKNNNNNNKKNSDGLSKKIFWYKIVAIMYTWQIDNYTIHTIDNYIILNF